MPWLAILLYDGGITTPSYCLTGQRASNARRGRRQVVEFRGVSERSGRPAVKMRASLSFYLLGPLRAQRGGALLTLRYNKARALLAWLALEPAFHTRDALADLLWPAAPTRVGRERLKRMLFHLREVLGDDVIEASRHVVRLKPNVLAWLDARDFQQRAETGRCLSGGRNTSFTRAQLDAFEQAVRLVRGPFLHGLDVADAPALEHWIDRH